MGCEGVLFGGVWFWLVGGVLWVDEVGKPLVCGAMGFLCVIKRTCKSFFMS